MLAALSLNSLRRLKSTRSAISVCCAMAAAVTSSTCSQSEPYDVAIIGGGLSGLVTASRLPKDTRWVLLEASPQLGGRLKNAEGLGDDNPHVDMGAAWCWPSQQPKVRALLKALNLQSFAQPDDDGGYTHRVQGGTYALVAALAAHVAPRGEVRMNWPLQSCAHLPPSSAEAEHGAGDKAPVIKLTNQAGEEVWARAAVLAVPPKLLAERVTFDPPLDPSRASAMRDSRTWMAGVTKVALAFPTRFWPLGPASSMGLNNGPAFQVYDGGGSSSSDDASATTTNKKPAPGVLTFFALATGVDDDQELAQSVARQLASVWARAGMREEATRLIAGCEKGGSSLDTANRAKVAVQRWPRESFIADDTAPTTIHPHPYPVRALGTPAWHGQLLFASTEADQGSPGVMEGAIGAGHAAASLIQKVL